jgi:hypothetical protein
MVSLGNDRLVELSFDSNQPYIVNLIAKNLLSDG